MQTAIQVICTSGTSLRTAIARHPRKLESLQLEIVAEKAQRNPGWMKIRGTERKIWGALNISWYPDTMTLTGRIVNKRYGRPHQIVGRFVEFLLRHHYRRIKAISVFEV